MINNKPVAAQFNFWKWLHKNRIKVVTYSFLIIIPLTLLLTAYIGTYTTHTKVHFDQEVTENTEYISKFTDMDEIDAFELSIDWKELKYPVLNEDDELSGGYYMFSMFYTAKQNYSVISMTVTPVLKTNWTDIRSMGNPVTLTPSARNVQIPFNYELPVKPLWFVTVEEPILYLKIDYTFVTATNEIAKTVYIQFILSDINPDKVVA
jgi:hypothetical protein